MRQIHIAADDTLFFYFIFFLLLSFEKIRLDVSCEEDSHKISSLIFAENNDRVFMNVVCCSRD